jgi:hypothetical protein
MALFFYESHFFQAPQMTLGLAELSGQESLDKIPSDGGPHGSATHAKDVHVIVLDPLPSREVVVD